MAQNKFTVQNGTVYKGKGGYDSLQHLIAMQMNGIAHNKQKDCEITVGSVIVKIDSHTATATTGEKHIDLFNLLEAEIPNIPTLE